MNEQLRQRSRSLTIAAVPVILLAFGLRLWDLNASSLWYDETFMLYHAQQDLSRALGGLFREDNALPLYGLLLTLWVRVAGSGEFAARYLSVLLGTTAAPFVLLLGRAVLGRARSGIGALLAYATLPIFVYYSQEVRMYALAIPLAAAFAWAGWRVIVTRRGAVGYVALGLLMLMSHLYTALIWLAVGLWGTLSLLLQRINRQGIKLNVFRQLKHPAWWRANLVLAGSSSPIVLWALWRARADATAVSAIPSKALRWLPMTFGVGQYLAPPWSILFVAIAVVSFTSAVLGVLFQRRVRSALWLMITLTVPVIALFLLTSIKSKWSERYLLPSWGLALVVGCGAGWETLVSPPSQLTRGRRALQLIGALLLGAWLTMTTPAIARQAQGTWALAIRDEWHPRPDFRSVSRYIEDHDGEDDAIVVVGGYAVSAIDYYYKGPAKLFGLPLGAQTLDTERAIDLRALATLERETQGYSRLWLVLWQEHLADPTKLTQSVLVESCRRLPVASTFNNVGLLLFDLSSCGELARLAEPPNELHIRFQAPIELWGYGISRQETTWEVDLWWRTTGSLTEDYTVFVHLLGPDGALVDQHDHIAGADGYPTSAWSPGTRLRDRFFLEVPDGTCPDCRLHVGLYTSERRLLLESGGDFVEIRARFKMPDEASYR
ncbi:MAG: glycosyltransferase family 39 protein [Anaerolineae bacterium]